MQDCQTFPQVVPYIIKNEWIELVSYVWKLVKERQGKECY